MGRLPTITNEQILNAAREVFLAEGFGASTVDIARRAGISEGSIFKRFSTKEELFFAAMGISDTPTWIKELETLPGRGDLKENLITLSLQILEFLREVMPRLMMIRSKGSLPCEFGGMREPLPVRDLRVLATFFTHELKLGRLRSCNPEVAASMLIGPLVNYVFLEQMGASTQIDAETFVQNLVEILWEGVVPTEH